MGRSPLLTARAIGWLGTQSGCRILHVVVVAVCLDEAHCLAPLLALLGPVGQRTELGEKVVARPCDRSSQRCLSSLAQLSLDGGELAGVGRRARCG